MVKSSEFLNEASRVMLAEANAIHAAKDRLGQTFVKAVELVLSALSKHGKIIVTGVGKSGKIAAKVSATFSSTGTPSIFLHPTEGLHGDLGIVTENDVVLVFSYSGRSTEVLQILPSLQQRKTPIISILGNMESPIAKVSQCVLDGSIDREACPLNLAPTSSTTVALAIGDALALVVSKARGFQEKDFAENHPGGSLGKRLTLRVSDLMHADSKITWVLPSTPATEIIQALSEKKLGAILVHEKNQILEGIITDGDIRRFLLKGPDFFKLTAEKIMTKKPVTVVSEDLAIKALELMENRPSQISVLPVVDATGRGVGLIRIHDLIGNL